MLEESSGVAGVQVQWPWYALGTEYPWAPSPPQICVLALWGGGGVRT